MYQTNWSSKIEYVIIKFATRVAKIIVGNGTPFKIYGWGDNPKIHAPW